MHSSLTPTQTDTFAQQVLAVDNTIVVVAFGAPWCAPCRRLTPLLADVVAERQDTVAFYADVAESPELAQRYGVRMMPSLVVFKDGQQVQRHVGLTSRAGLVRLLEQVP